MSRNSKSSSRQTSSRPSKEEQSALKIKKLEGKVKTQATETQAWFTDVPKPATISVPSTSLSSADYNYTAIIQSTVAQIMADSPEAFRMKTTVFPTICPTTLTNYLHWLCASVLRERGLVSSTDIYGPTFASANEDLLIPNPLAKMLEYMMPYTDKVSLITLENTYNMPAFNYGSTKQPNLITTAADSWVCTVNDVKCQQYAMSGTRSAAQEYPVNTTAFTGNATLADYIANAGFFNSFLAGVADYCVPIKKIPKHAPDASFYSTWNNNNTAMNFTPHFDPEMAGVWQIPNNANNTYTTYARPYTKTGVYQRILKSSFSTGWQSGSAYTDVRDHFVHLCCRSPWRKGIIKKMLLDCKYGRVKSLIRILFYNDLNAVGQALAFIYSQYQVSENDALLYDTMVHSAIVARLAPYSWIGQTSFSTGGIHTNQNFYDQTYSTVPYHPLIANLISRMGPIVLPDGVVVYPKVANGSVTLGSYEKPPWFIRFIGLNNSSLIAGQSYKESVKTSTAGPASQSLVGMSAASADASCYGATPFSATQTILTNYSRSSLRSFIGPIEIPLTTSKMGHPSSYCVATGANQVDYGVVSFSSSVTGTYSIPTIDSIGNLLFPTDIGVLKQGVYYYGACSWATAVAADATDKDQTIQKIRMSYSVNPLTTMVDFMSSDFFKSAIGTAAGNVAGRGKQVDYYPIVNELVADKMDSGISTYLEAPTNTYWETAKNWAGSSWNTTVDIIKDEVYPDLKAQAVPAFKKGVLKAMEEGAYTAASSLISNHGVQYGGAFLHHLMNGNMPRIGNHVRQIGY